RIFGIAHQHARAQVCRGDVVKLKLAFSLLAAVGMNLQAADSIPVPARGKVIGTYVLPRLSLSQFGNPDCSDAVLARARQNGLKFTDLPSIGSGLAHVRSDEFVGITDRGPNGLVLDGGEERHTFPLPEFCPTIVRFTLAEGKIRPTEFIPLTGSDGRRITGLSNMKGDGHLYEFAARKKPLPYDQNGIDPESVRIFPDGGFLVGEEYAPSLLVVSPKGEIRMRYTPVSRPVAGARYPTKAILPAIFAQRRDNRGFENLALSRDGRFAYAILQGPMGDDQDKRFEKSRIVRILKLDVADPLNLKVVGEYLARTSPAKEFRDKTNQRFVSWSDAEWIAPDVLVVSERGHGEVKLQLVDLRDATNVLGRKDESGLIYENVSADLAALGIKPAVCREVFSTRDTPGINNDKIEGITVLNATDIALANDNDFGIGENPNGEPSQIWIVRLASPLPVENAGR
ncbi:MAG TPA: esterase-like activity of phytase family protein, partial [Candidatus Paceibacterota bacterium]|nr:esterase-like activity of phytase family protein [Candidatus Paceibacterota bacterium]